MEQLRLKLPAIPARRAETATSNRFGSLSEPSGKDDSKGAWNFHPLFMQTGDDEPLGDQPTSLPATAFPDWGWWKSPASSIEEANKLVEAGRLRESAKDATSCGKTRNSETRTSSERWQKPSQKRGLLIMQASRRPRLDQPRSPVRRSPPRVTPQLRHLAHALRNLRRLTSSRTRYALASGAPSTVARHANSMVRPSAQLLRPLSLPKKPLRLRQPEAGKRPGARRWANATVRSVTEAAARSLKGLRSEKPKTRPKRNQGWRSRRAWR